MLNKPNRRIRLLAVAAGVALVAAACSGASTSEAPTSGADATTDQVAVVENPAPAGEFLMFDGSSATFADFGGKPVVLNFWASWCPSCVAEMSAAFRPVEQELGADIVFLGMNIQDERDLAEELLAETGVEWLNAEDAVGQLYTELGGLGMPFTVFISPDGGIVDSHNGPLSEDLLRARIAEVFPA